MRTLFLLATLLLVLPLCAMGAQNAADTTLLDALSGKTFPLSYKLQDLDTSWSRVKIRLTGEGGASGANILAGLLGGAGQGGATYFTQGRTFAAAGKTYLVAYSLPATPLDIARLMTLSQGGGDPTPDSIMSVLMPKPKPDAVLSLSLLDMYSIGSLEEARPFDLAQVTSEPISESPLASLAAILFPVFSQARGKAREVSSESNLKQLGLATIMYCQDYDEVFPSVKDAATIKKNLMPYVKDEAVFVNPTTKEPYRANLFVSRKSLARIETPAETILFYEPTPGLDGFRAVVFVDGHAKRVDDAEWNRLKKISKMP